MAGAAFRSIPVDWTFRPESYWNNPDAVFTNIMGSWRRRLVEKVARGEHEDVPERFLADQLSPIDRKLAGLCHPYMMGGEYLPPYLRHEVEIARVELNSTTHDVISIRARPRGSRIAYRVVDEYEGDYDHKANYTLPRRSSRLPLSLAELVEVIDGTVMVFGGDPAKWRGLVIPHNREVLADEWDPNPVTDLERSSDPKLRATCAGIRMDASIHDCANCGRKNRLRTTQTHGMVPMCGECGGPLLQPPAADTAADGPRDAGLLATYAEAIREACSFATVSSEFYSELARLYEIRTEAFVSHLRIDLGVLTPAEGALPATRLPPIEHSSETQQDDGVSSTGDDRKVQP